MEVNLELKPIQWGPCQEGYLHCGEDWILLYSVNDTNNDQWEATFELTCCTKLSKKHKLKSKHESYTETYFDSREEAVKACEAHYRELMLTAFLQPV
jgi:hypothetical protein